MTDRMPASNRSPGLKDASGSVESDTAATIDLPDTVEPGGFAFTFTADAWGTGDPSAFDVEFDWPGDRHATFSMDISAREGTSPLSSSPCHGWVSWQNGTDLLLAYVMPDEDVEGWARLTDGAPAAGGNDDEVEDALLAEPQHWVELARRILAVVHELDLPGLTGERWENEYGLEE